MKADMLAEATHAQQAELMERARRDIDARKRRRSTNCVAKRSSWRYAGASKVIKKNRRHADRCFVESYLSSIK